MGKLDATAVKRAARGKWAEILGHVGGIPSEVLDGKNHPCPRPGCPRGPGRDRFRFTDMGDDGSVLCNQCGKGIGDGFAALRWFLGIDFPAALERVAEYLGTLTSRNGHSASNGKPREVAAYDYRNMAGELIFQAVRFEPKDFRQRRPLPDGKWTWTVKDLPDALRCLPYRLPELLAADPAQTIFVVEGEKDVDNCRERGLVATCNAGGAGKWRSEHASHLRGRNVVILPDNDLVGNEVGQKHAHQVAKSLVGVASSIKVVQLPGLPDKGDVSDYFEAGGTAEDLLRFVDACPEWDPSTPEPQSTTPSESPRGPRITTLADAAQSCIDLFRAGKGQPLPLGIPDLDEALGGGVQPGELVVLAARPTHGKSAVALQIVHSLTERETPVVIISEEMSAIALGKRALLFMSETPQEHWRTSLSQLEKDLYEYRSKRKPAYIVESCRTVQAAVEQIEKAVADHGVKAAVVDYAQLLGAEGRDRYQIVTNVSIALRQVTTKHNLLTLMLCQMNREVEAREKFIPKPSDLKDSGQLEQDCDVLVFLCWPHRLNSDRNPKEFLFFVSKNRNRPINRTCVKCEFRPSRQMVVSEQAAYQPPVDRCVEFDPFDGRGALFDTSEEYR